MKILFFVSNYRHDSLKLQPWLTIQRIGSIFIQNGHSVHIATDCASGTIYDFEVHFFETLRNRSKNSIEALIKKINPDKIIVCISPLSLLTTSWYNVFQKYDTYGFMSNAFYTYKEYLKAVPYLSMHDLIGFGKQAMIPRIFLKPYIVKWFKGLICQSTNTSKRMQHTVAGKVPVHFIPPGIDLELWPLVKKKIINGSNERLFLYAGSLKKIRGYTLILKAFSQILSKDIRLRILARGADENQVHQIESQIKAYGIQNRVEIVGGWIPQENFREHFRQATAVLLPFVLVPSELPVTVMESIACGTPVIVSQIDGLPGAAGKAGVVIPHADHKALAKAIESLHTDFDKNKKIRQACAEVRSTMCSWEIVADRWFEALN